MNPPDIRHHPTKDIIGSKSNQLMGKTICMCLTSSVAIMNSPMVARELMRHGAEVISVMSEEATKLINPTLMQWSTGNQVITKITGDIEHVAMAGERENSNGLADMILVYPATANTIGKIANGISDNAVTAIATVALGSKTPLIVVPAMHDSMFRNSIVQENITKLKTHEVTFLGPRLEESKAKIASPDDVVKYILNYYSSKKDFIGKSAIITAGATREWIDEVRFISNPSTGKMGISIAEELIARGAEVTILLGKTVVDVPFGCEVIRCDTTADFISQLTNILKAEKNYDLLISAAALGDFTPISKINSKISSKEEFLEIKLKSTPKLINIARNLSPNLKIIGFKAEPEESMTNLIQKATERIESAKIDLIIANNVKLDQSKTGFGTDTNEVYIINKHKEFEHIPLSTKRNIAHNIVDSILKQFFSN